MDTAKRAAFQTSVQGKLAELGYSTADDTVMAEYVCAMIANDKSADLISNELADLVGSDFDPTFTAWLFRELDRVRRGVVARVEASGTSVNGSHVPAPAPAAVDMDTEDSSAAHGSGELSVFAPYDSGADQRRPDASQTRQGPNPRLFGNAIRTINENDERSRESATAVAAARQRGRDEPRLRRLDGNAAGAARPRERRRDLSPKAGSGGSMLDRIGPRVRGNGPLGAARGQMNGRDPGATSGIFNPAMMTAGNGAPMSPNLDYGPTMAALATNGGMGTGFGLVGNKKNTMQEVAVRRCSHWLRCSFGVNCRNFHPTQLCIRYPNCAWKDATCQYIHPEDIPTAKDLDMTDTIRIQKLAEQFVTSLQEKMTRQLMQQGGLVWPGKSVEDLMANYAQMFGMGMPGPTHAAPAITSNGSGRQQELNPKASSFHHGNKSVSFPNPTSSNTNPDKHSIASSAPIQYPTAPLQEDLCKYSTKCTNKYCGYSHPTPANQDENALVLKSESCPEGYRCQNAECVLSHPSPAIVKDPTPSGTALKSQEPCRFNQSCTNPKCFYTHTNPTTGQVVPPPASAKSSTPFTPSDSTSSSATAKVQIPCRYGDSCHRPGCHFTHPRDGGSGISPSRNRTAVFNTMVDRSFAIDESEVEKIVYDTSSSPDGLTA